MYGCESGFSCVSGQCLRACNETQECPYFSKCSSENIFCYPECTIDDECIGYQTCHPNGYCVAGDIIESKYGRRKNHVLIFIFTHIIFNHKGVMNYLTLKTVRQCQGQVVKRCTALAAMAILSARTCVRVPPTTSGVFFACNKVSPLKTIESHF